MDRDALARRNRRIAAARHQPTRKHQLRDRILRIAALAPIPRQRRTAHRLLVIRPDHLGDALLATPAIRHIKQARPEMEIHALCGAWTADLLARFDEIDRVIPLPFPGFARGDRGGNPYLLALRWTWTLRRTGYDAAIVMRPDHWWGALLAHLAGIPRRIGYGLPNVAPFLTDTCALRREHAVLQNMRLAARFTGESLPVETSLSFPIRGHDRAAIDERLLTLNLPGEKPLVCIHPGSGAVSKLWTSEKWAQAADKLHAAFDCAIAFTGAKSEQPLIAEIRARMSSASYAIGETTIGQLAALNERASLVLGPDSGALHVAAAVDAPTVALFGPADQVEFAPWGNPRRHVVLTADWSCAPCRILDWRNDEMEDHPCVRDISVAQALDAASRMLSQG